MKDLSVIIPVYNEEKALGETVGYFEDLLTKNPGLEVIFVNDASTDRSAEILAGVKNKKIKIINQTKNNGYGASIKRGLKDVSYENIAITDADGSYPNENICELFEIFLNNNADMVVGARTGKIREIGVFRRFAKSILNKLARYLSEEDIPDLNSGLRVVKKNLVLRFLRFLPDGFSFTTTLTLSLLANNGKILYLPVNYFKRKGKSKIRPVRDTLNFLQLIIRTIMFFNPLKIFLPLSIFFILLSLLILVITYLLGKVMDITVVLLFITGLNFLAIGLLADLIDKRINR